MLLLSFYRQAAQLHWAKEISFRFHQQFVRNQDFQSSPTLLTAESRVRIPLPGLAFQAQQEHSAGAGLSHSTTSAVPSSLHTVQHNPSFVILLTSSQESLWCRSFKNPYLPLRSKKRKKPNSLEHLGVHHLLDWWKSIEKSDFPCYGKSHSFAFTNNFPGLHLNKGWHFCGNKQNSATSVQTGGCKSADLAFLKMSERYK